MKNNYAYLGMVEGGKFKPLATEKALRGSFRLTTSSIQPPPTPESGELSLAQYEGNAILVRGVDRGEWIYSAMVVEQAGLILTAVVQEVFGSADTRDGYRLKYPLAGGK
ncbi:MAG: hypothetical protein WAO55_08935 [Candidatus Manganitrophaceae bacterium]